MFLENYLIRMISEGSYETADWSKIRIWLLKIQEKKCLLYYILYSFFSVNNEIM